MGIGRGFVGEVRFVREFMDNLFVPGSSAVVGEVVGVEAEVGVGERGCADVGVGVEKRDEERCFKSRARGL